MEHALDVRRRTTTSMGILRVHKTVPTEGNKECEEKKANTTSAAERSQR